MLTYKHLQEEPLLGPTNITQNPSSGFNFFKSLLFLFTIAILFFWFSTIFVIVDIHTNIVSINTKKIIQTTNSKFLSLALDTSIIHRNWIPRLKFIINLTKPLSPGYLRIGGKLADNLIFKNEVGDFHGHFNQRLSLSKDNFETEIENITLTVDQWMEINYFAQITNLDLIFDLNVMLRSEEKWNSSNAEELLNFNDKNDFLINYQLGNEPNSFQHIFHRPVNATQLAKDYLVLRELLNNTVKQKESLIIGPEVTRPKEYGVDPISYLDEFLQTAVPSNAIDVVSWHQYYLNGRTAQLNDFLDIRIMNTLSSQIEQIKLIVNKHNSTLPIWISETSDSYGGGAPGLSDTFVSVFLWLDKLGLSALHGIKVVIRQSLFSSTSYSLINMDYEPNPCWWISVLYKRLVGPCVFSTHSITSGSAARVYAHCSPPTQLTVYALNPHHRETSIVLSGIVTSSLPGNDILVDEYIVVPRESLSYRSLLLNDIPLQLGPGGSVPPLSPRVIVLKPGGSLHMPPFSIAFWVFRDLRSDACQDALSK